MYLNALNHGLQLYFTLNTHKSSAFFPALVKILTAVQTHSSANRTALTRSGPIDRGLHHG
jgi:hypothetical protein